MLNELYVTSGTCQAIFAYDCGTSIDLNACERRVAATQRAIIRHQRRAPQYFTYHSPPLRVVQNAAALTVGTYCSNPMVELTIYDFGAIQVGYQFSLAGPLLGLLALSDLLYDNADLLSDSRHRVEALVDSIKDTVTHPEVTGFVEDYLIFELNAVSGLNSGSELLTEHAGFLAQLLRASRSELSPDEISDATTHHLSFATNDIAVVDWNATVILDASPEDVRAVLEFANVELLEMRYLDQRLDQALEEAYQLLTRKGRASGFLLRHDADLNRIGELQVDSAILFEGVNNALKLLGDQYLARIYRLVSQRFHLTEWDSSILRKIETLESIYQKLSDRVAARRMELVEWIIVALFVVSIVLPFLIGH